MQWEVPKMWVGETVYILGGGPSLNNLDIGRLRGQKVIAINNAYKIAPWAPILFFMDCRWWYEHNDNLKNFQGLIVTVCGDCKDHPRVLYLRRGHRNAIDARPTHIMRASNSGVIACNLAVKLGAKKIVLFGFDMKKVDGNHNWHRDHSRNVPDKIYEDQFLNSFHQLAKCVPDWQVEVLNATPGSALQEFPIVKPEDVYP